MDEQNNTFQSPVQPQQPRPDSVVQPQQPFAQQPVQPGVNKRYTPLADKRLPAVLSNILKTGKRKKLDLWNLPIDERRRLCFNKQNS